MGVLPDILESFVMRRDTPKPGGLMGFKALSQFMAGLDRMASPTHPTGDRLVGFWCPSWNGLSVIRVYFHLPLVSLGAF